MIVFAHGTGGRWSAASAAAAFTIPSARTSRYRCCRVRGIGAGAHHCRVKRKRTIECLDVRIDEKLRRAETVTVMQVVRAMRAQPVAFAGGDPGNESVKDVRRCARATLYVPARIRRTRPNRHNSIALACAENSAKLTPSRSSVTPSGSGIAVADAAHRSGGPACARSRKERSVLLRRTGPADVGSHRAQLQTAPNCRIAPQHHGASHRELEMSSRHRRELDARAGTAASAISLASITVSASPPTRATTGTVP